MTGVSWPTISFALLAFIYSAGAAQAVSARRSCIMARPVLWQGVYATGPNPAPSSGEAKSDELWGLPVLW